MRRPDWHCACSYTGHMLSKRQWHVSVRWHRFFVTYHTVWLWHIAIKFWCCDMLALWHFETWCTLDLAMYCLVHARIPHRRLRFAQCNINAEALILCDKSYSVTVTRCDIKFSCCDRTSVDHGTAFDIAGQGIAHESNLLTVRVLLSCPVLSWIACDYAVANHWSSPRSVGLQAIASWELVKMLTIDVDRACGVPPIVFDVAKVCPRKSHLSKSQQAMSRFHVTFSCHAFLSQQSLLQFFSAMWVAH